MSIVNEYKIKHDFRDCINPLCLCSLEAESFSHYFPTVIISQIYTCHPISELQSVDMNFPKLDSNRNCQTLSSCINFILKSERFYFSLLLKHAKLIDNKASSPHSYLKVNPINIHSYN